MTSNHVNPFYISPNNRQDDDDEDDDGWNDAWDDDDEDDEVGLLGGNRITGNNSIESRAHASYYAAKDRQASTGRYLFYGLVVIVLGMIVLGSNNGKKSRVGAGGSFTEDDHAVNSKTPPILKERTVFDNTTRIAVLGERHSGVPWLTEKLKECFQTASPAVTVESGLFRSGLFFQEETYTNDDPENVVAVSIFVNPYDWVWAMKELPRYAPAHRDVADWEEFMNKTWTTDRPESDHALEALEDNDRPCQLNYAFEQVVGCTRAPEEHDPLTHPIYEMDYDFVTGVGKPFGNILKLREAKIWNFIETVPHFRRVKKVVPVMYEGLMTEAVNKKNQNTEGLPGILPLVLQLKKLLGVEDGSLGCDLRAEDPVQLVPHFAPPLSVRHEDMPHDFLEYIKDNVDWQLEFSIGYSSWDSDDIPPTLEHWQPPLASQEGTDDDNTSAEEADDDGTSNDDDAAEDGDFVRSEEGGTDDDETEEDDDNASENDDDDDAAESEDDDAPSAREDDDDDDDTQDDDDATESEDDDVSSESEDDDSATQDDDDDTVKNEDDDGTADDDSNNEEDDDAASIEDDDETSENEDDDGATQDDDAADDDNEDDDDATEIEDDDGAGDDDNEDDDDTTQSEDDRDDDDAVAVETEDDDDTESGSDEADDDDDAESVEDDDSNDDEGSSSTDDDDADDDDSTDDDASNDDATDDDAGNDDATDDETWLDDDAATDDEAETEKVPEKPSKEHKSSSPTGSGEPKDASSSGAESDKEKKKKNHKTKANHETDETERDEVEEKSKKDKTKSHTKKEKHKHHKDKKKESKEGDSEEDSSLRQIAASVIGVVADGVERRLPSFI